MQKLFSLAMVQVYYDLRIKIGAEHTGAAREAPGVWFKRLLKRARARGRCPRPDRADRNDASFRAFSFPHSGTRITVRA